MNDANLLVQSQLLVIKRLLNLPDLTKNMLLLIFVQLIMLAATPVMGQQTVTDSNQNNSFKPKVWALICSDDLVENGLSDLLTADLTEKKFDLVERQSIETVIRELERGGESSVERLAGNATSERLKFGEMLSADALILLSTAQTKEGLSLQLVICDCQFGTRLHFWQTNFDDAKFQSLTDRCAEQVLATKNRFANGIKQIVGVAPLQAKNLSYEFDQYQQSFQYVVQSGLMSRPGIAAIEIEEAQAIQTELATSERENLKRVVLTLLEGEFEATKDLDDGSVQFRLKLIVKHDAKESLLQPEPMTLEQTMNFLSKTLPEKLLPKNARGTNIDGQSQLSWLTNRADSFAVRGDWDQSMALREAALLLQPKNVEQRRALVYEKLSFCQTVSNEQPRLEKLPPDHADVEAFVRSKGDAYLSYLKHLEYLIRNRLICTSEAVAMTRTAYELFIGQSAFGPLWEPFKELSTRVTSKEADFFDNVNGKIFELPNDFNYRVFNSHLMNERVIKNERDLKVAWYELYFLSMRFRLSGDYQSVADVKRMESFLLQVYPDGLPIDDQIFSYFSQPSQLTNRGRRFAKKFPDAASPDEVRNFVRRLIESDHRTASFLGRYALFAYERNQLRLKEYQTSPKHDNAAKQNVVKVNRAKYEKLIEDSEKLINDFDQLPYDDDLPVDGRKNETAWQLLKFEHDEMVNLVENSTTDEMKPNRAKGIYEDDRRDAAGIVTTKTIELRFNLSSPDRRVDDILGGPASPNEPGYKSWQRELYLKKCGDIDVWWNRRAVLVMRKKGILEEVSPPDSAAKYSDVCWDGKNIWVASKSKGIQLLDPQRLTLKQHSGVDQGLPPSDLALLLAAVEPGKIIATGAFGRDSRVWCATISSDQLAPKLIFEATNVQTKSAGQTGFNDVATVFEPMWIARYPSDDADSTQFLIGRDPEFDGTFIHERTPILIDSVDGTIKSFGETLQTSSYYYINPDMFFFHSRGKRIFSTHWFSVSVVEHPNSADKKSRGGSKSVCEISEEIYKNGFPAGSQNRATCLVVRDEKLIVPGLEFFELDPITLEQKRFVSSNPNEHLKSHVFYGDSIHYGIIGWNGWTDDKFEVTQFEIKPERTVAKETE